ncbi:MAG: serine hydroxymethyltransferase [Phycisphaerales bacterium]
MTAQTDAVSAAPHDVIGLTDPQIADLIRLEQQRQEQTLELIASENHTSPAVMAASGSCLTNKYCEGYVGKRYYSGCQYYDDIEQIAIDRVTKLFGCKFANVQPHSGANANMAAFVATLKPGDTFSSIVLSGRAPDARLACEYLRYVVQPEHYPLVHDESREDFGHIDYDAVIEVCKKHKPKLLICGYSAYPRTIDFAKFREAADTCGAVLMADIAHIAGLVAAGVHPSPFPHCDIVTTTTHKTLRGPRGGLIMTNDEEIAKKIDRALFPGIQGGPLMHIVAAKAVAFGEALKPEFKTYSKQVVKNADALAKALMGLGYALTSRGTDNHLMVIDLRKTDAELTGKIAALWLEQAGIITSKSTIPQDDRSPFQTSGVRLGTPALTTRGLKEAEMKTVADLIHRVISSGGDETVLAKVRLDVQALCQRFPMPH